MVYSAPTPALDGPALDAVFGALAHPSRRTLLLHLLGRRGPMGVAELAAAAGMSPQLLNKHAGALERAGLVTREPAGREKRVRAHPEALAPARAWIEETTAYWNAQLDALGEYIEATREQAEPPDEQED